MSVSTKSEKKIVPDAVPEDEGQDSYADQAVEAAKDAGLRYITDTAPGFRRERRGDEVVFLGLDGEPIVDEKVLARIRALVIPPAWTDVWIAPIARGHLQATGRDAKGRKQYRYHAKWRAARDETKYGKLVLFGETLPMVRKWIDHDLTRHGLVKEKVLATVVGLLDETHIRIGNEEYARTNDSFGLTTLHNDHASVSGATIKFTFRGKSGKDHVVTARDRRLARIVKLCQEIPGQDLFEYQDDEDQPHVVASDDVNTYLHQITGQHFTAKDFRTWAGTVVAAHALRQMGPPENETQGKKNVVAAIKAAADELGNTPAICRKSYVHPGVIEAYLQGHLAPSPVLQEERAAAEERDGLHPEEAEVLAILRGLMAQSSTKSA